MLQLMLERNEQVMEHHLNDMMGTTMSNIKQMIDVNTIVGTPINTPDGTTIIPVSKVSFGFASGGSDFQAKNQTGDSNFGGGGGAGVTITPVSFLVVNNGNVRLIPVSVPASSSVDRIIEQLPELIEKVKEMLPKKGEKPEEDPFVR